jgi:hypothetical protein
MRNPKRTVVLTSNPKISKDLDFSKDCNIDGATFTRSTTGTVVDFEGITRAAKTNEVRFQAARRVENILTATEDFSNAFWAKTLTGTGTATVSSDKKSITFTCAVGDRAFINITTMPSIVAGSHVLSVTQVVNSGTPSSSCSLGSAGGGPSVTTSCRFSYVSASTGTTYRIGLGCAGASATAASVTLSFPQVEPVAGQTNKVPADYVSVGVLAYPYHGAGVDGVKYFNTTNGNTVSSNVVTEAAGTPLTGITLLAEDAGTNLLLNSATPVTQNITTTAQRYTLSMWGTGTCTLTGAATGTLTGTGATARVSLTVTATAGTLTLTFAGTNTNGQAEAGALMSSYIATTSAAVTRTADVLSFTGASLDWYNPSQGTFIVKASGSSFNAPYNLGTLNQTLSTPTNYSVNYNNNTKSGSTYLSIHSTVNNPTEFTSISTPTTLYLSSGGIANISRFSYYPKKLKTNKLANLL